MGTPTVGQRLRPLVGKGEIATCSIVDLEVLFSARSPQEYAAASSDRAQAYPKIPIHQASMDRAAEVQSALAKRSQHRAVSIPDLIIAATAEQAGLIVLHYDADFDMIGDVTGQPMEWVVPAGSVG